MAGWSSGVAYAECHSALVRQQGRSADRSVQSACVVQSCSMVAAHGLPCVVPYGPLCNVVLVPNTLLLTLAACNTGLGRTDVTVHAEGAELLLNDGNKQLPPCKCLQAPRDKSIQHVCTHHDACMQAVRRIGA
jgi:hypothetical protein